MFEMWFLTVFGLMCSSAAMSALSLPFAMSFSTSISRSESSVRIERLDSRMRARRADALEDFPGDVRGDERLATRRGPDPSTRSLDRGVLQEVAARAGEDRVGDVRVLVRDRQHDDARERRELGDLPGRVDTAHRRHVEIHHDDVGRELADMRNGVRARRGLADDLDPLLLEEAAQARAEEILVVDEKHAKRLRRPRSLISTSSGTATPPSGHESVPKGHAPDSRRPN